jgi:hypothetical protein
LRVSRSKILVVVPTTNGPLRLRALRPRPGLPASAAFADGDYRPLPWSGDYARLCASGGPLARLASSVLPPHELRLSGSFDAGRSWEAAVCLAHGLAARGHVLVAEPVEAELIVWATGAVDLDLAVIPGDYALLDKIERSRPLLAEAPGAALAVLLPDGPEREAAVAAIRALGREHPHIFLPSSTISAALNALAEPADPAPIPPPVRRWRFALPAGVVAVACVAVAVAFGVLRAPSAGPQEPSIGDPAATAVTTSKTDVADPAPKPPEKSAPPPVRVEELRAPAGSSCRRVAFGADPPERRTVALESEGRLAPTRLTPDLCGIAFLPEAAGTSVEVGPELRSASLPPVRLADGAQAYFLKESGRQNLVYAVQVNPGSGPPGARFVHALTR